MQPLSPMLKQYHSIKSEYPDCILFFRLGDFYEMFYKDAKKAAGILDLVLTSRGKGASGKVPMCGIPHHASESYIARLIKANQKVAICEQVEDPSKSKGIVKREVTRIISSGTFIDADNAGSRYTVSITPTGQTTGLAFTDPTSGIIQANEYADPFKIIELISRLPVYECIFPQEREDFIKELFGHPLLKIKTITLTPYDDWCFNAEIAEKSLKEHFKTHSLRGFGIDEMNAAKSSCGALLEYFRQMNKQPMRHLHKISLHTQDDYAYISPAAMYGLGIEELIETLDNTRTPMGKRTFRHWVCHPLKSAVKIEERQKAVTALKNSPEIRDELGGLLNNIADMEKALLRISSGYIKGRDLLMLRNTLIKYPGISAALQPLAGENPVFRIQDAEDIRLLLEKAVNPDMPLAKCEGKVIRQGYNAELDELRSLQENSKNQLAEMQAREIEQTGISSLKIGYNKVFGYYIEVTKTNLNLVPAHFIRKQTLVNAERFITPELKEFEEKILTAEDKVLSIENSLIDEIREAILQASPQLHAFSKSLADIDAIYSMSITAGLNNYILPQVNDSTQIDIADGRHPVVELTVNDRFIPNDSLLDCTENHLLIITGPNMSGKSTYIRQTAILVIMAQTGSYIPAKSAKIGITDKIFTRIGAHDEITKGQSTFMVEMTETAHILNNLSQRSLIILDEIGRGTSTFDGLSLARAIAEYLQKHKVRTLFATHFHQLTALEQEYTGIKNYNVAIKEYNDEIIFMHKIIPGGTDDSYGIYVAQLAGIPKEVLEHSRTILSQIESSDAIKENMRIQPSQVQLSIFDNNGENNALEELRDEIESIDINSLTPVEALNVLNKLKEKLNNRNALQVTRNKP